MIGGNIEGLIQIKESSRNLIGEAVQDWTDVGSCLGWLDYASGENSVEQFRAKVQETTHYFLCDYLKWKNATEGTTVTAENCRMVINDEVYNVLLIDDPMGMHQHMEVYLKYVGGGLGV